MTRKNEHILEARGGRLVTSKRKKTVDFRDPIIRYGKKYFYELTLYSRMTAVDRANTIRNHGRWGFRVRIIKDEYTPGKFRYHLYSRSRKPGVE